MKHTIIMMPSGVKFGEMTMDEIRSDYAERKIQGDWLVVEEAENPPQTVAHLFPDVMAHKKSCPRCGLTRSASLEFCPSCTGAFLPNNADDSRTDKNQLIAGLTLTALFFGLMALIGILNGYLKSTAIIGCGVVILFLLAVGWKRASSRNKTLQNINHQIKIVAGIIDSIGNAVFYFVASIVVFGVLVYFARGCHHL